VRNGIAFLSPMATGFCTPESPSWVYRYFLVHKRLFVQ
jgi:hypothetical protein